MVAFILPANSATGGYEIDNSLRFNYPDNPQLSFTPSSDGNKRVATASFWLKRGVSRASNDLHIMGSQEDGSNLYSIRIRSSGNADVFQFLNAVSGSTSNGFTYKTNASFRDHSAWYHFVVAMDVTQSDGNNGLKLYVNGVLQTAYSISNYNQNVDVSFNTSGEAMKIGIKSDDSEPFDGYLADFHWIDGTQKQASDFGEYNDNGVWIPKKYDGSYGTNGFYLEFKQTGTSQNSSGIGADTSGNDNHFAVTNLAATDVTVDTPTNNFCTLSSIDVNVGQVPTFEEGNTKFTVASGNNHSRTDATIRPSSGKWYAEFTFLSGYSTANGTTQVGIISGNAGRYASNNDGYDQDNGNDSEAIGYRSNGSVKNHGTESLSGLTTFTTDDIMGIALDLDNDKFFVSKNGTFFTNGTGTQDPANGTNPLFSGGVITSHKIHGFNIGAKGYGDAQNVIAANFGNPHTSISSGNADANGYGNFEYAVPSGYYSLCTRNLAEYG